MHVRIILALVVVAATAAAVETPGLEQPLKSPVAKRLRAKAAKLHDQAQAVHAKTRQPPGSETYPSPDELSGALATAEGAIWNYEQAQRKECDTSTNAKEASCLRIWIDLRKLVPPPEPPKDPEALKKWTKAKKRARAERMRDARRLFGKYESARRYTKLFSVCRRCDGRGDLRTAFGDKSVCPSCRGAKLHVDRKTLLASYWFCFSPFYRADSRHRARLNQVLVSGVRAQDRIAPFVLSYRIKGKAEDHGWWVRATVLEKLHDDPKSKKGTEKPVDYVMMKVGKAWWIHRGRADEQLLKIPEPEAAPAKPTK